MNVPPHAPRSNLGPYAALATVCAGWGTIPVLVRWAPVPAAAVVFARVAVAAAGLGLAVALRREPARPRLLRHRPLRCLFVAAVLAGHWLALFAAYRRVAVGTVILIVYFAPVGIAAVAPRVLGERLGPRTLAGLALGLTGFLLVAVPSVGEAQGPGLVLAVTAAASFVVLVVAAKPLAEAYGGLRLAFIEMTGASVLLLPLAVGADWGTPTVDWLWLVVLGLVHTAVGTGAYLAALARVPATHVGIMGYLEPASAVLFGWWLLAEVPSATMVGGGLLIVAAGVLVAIAARHEGQVARREVTTIVPG